MATNDRHAPALRSQPPREGALQTHPGQAAGATRKWFAEHPDEGLPALIAAVEARSPYTKGALQVLAMLDRAECVPAAAALLHQGHEAFGWDAGMTLAAISDHEVEER